MKIIRFGLVGNFDYNIIYELMKGLTVFAVGSFCLKRKDVNKWEIQEKLYITTFALLRS